jgi:7-carboxy-7-deazaguanine synthase
MKLVVSEMFTSLQGETTRAGYVSAFVRLAGCNLRCVYCDTKYAQSLSDGDPFEIEDIVSYVKNAGTIDHVTLTGGEPLFQSGVSELCSRLISGGYRVRIETNGSIDISMVPPPSERIVDVKTPSSGFCGSFNMANIPQLNERDEIKFVVSDESDLVFAKNFYDTNLRSVKSVINVSPAAGGLPYRDCAGFIIREMPRARMSIQLHKLIWPEGEPK